MDLFQTFDDEDRQALVETFKNTVKNADMYKNPSSRDKSARRSSPKKEHGKSVKFNDKLDILGPKSDL